MLQYFKDPNDYLSVDPFEPFEPYQPPIVVDTPPIVPVNPVPGTFDVKAISEIQALILSNQPVTTEQQTAYGYFLNGRRSLAEYQTAMQNGFFFSDAQNLEYKSWLTPALNQLPFTATKPVVRPELAWQGKRPKPRQIMYTGYPQTTTQQTTTTEPVATEDDLIFGFPSTAVYVAGGVAALIGAMFVFGGKK